MTIRIADFSDSVTSAITPSTNIPTGPAGADGANGAPGRAFQVDEFLNFTETVRTRIEAYGTPGMSDPNPNHGLVTTVNPYVIVVETDNRTASERTNGPAPLNSDVTRHVLEWSGAVNMTTNPNGGVWFDYGVFTGMAGADGAPGMNGTSATVAVLGTNTLAAGMDASVTNDGTASAASLTFNIPRGDDGNAGPAGSGIASLYPNGNADDAMVSNYTTSGTIGLTLSTTAADIIAGPTTFKITGATTGAKLISPEIDIPLGFRGGLMSLLFVYRSAFADQIKINITDENGVLITSSDNLVNSESSSSGSGSFNFAFNVLDNDKIKVEWEATGAVTEFLFDDVTITPDPLITLPDTTYSLPERSADNTNEYSSHITIGSEIAGGTLTRTDSPISPISTCVKGAQNGSAVITFTGSFFSAPPIITASHSGVGSTPAYATVLSVTTSGCSINCYDTGGTPFNGELYIDFRRSSTDVKSMALTANTEQTVVTYNEFLERENTFGALINNPSNSPSIVSQSGDFIAVGGVSSGGEGIVSITWTSGFFSVAPSVTCTQNPTGNEIISTNLATTTGVTIRALPRGTGASPSNSSFNIIVTRQGTDYKEPVQTGTFLLSPNNIEIMNNQVTGDINALTIGTELFSLGMNKAIENYTVNEFSVTITNEAATTGSGTLSLRLEKKADGLGNTGWTPISTISTTVSTGVVTGTLDMSETDIPKGTYVRIVPLTFKTDQESFHLFVQGQRSNG